MYLFYVIIAAVIVAADLTSKYFVLEKLKPIGSLPIIKDVFHLTFCKNTGAAFSIFSDKTYLLGIVSAAAIVAIAIYVAAAKPKSRLLLTALSMIVGGGAGNMADRLFRGYVVDFFDFRLINFAIFNVADVFICIGVGLLAVYLIFFADKNK